MMYLLLFLTTLIALPFILISAFFVPFHVVSLLLSADAVLMNIANYFIQKMENR